MCMTSTKTPASRYASSALPYHEEECPLSACQLSSLGATRELTASSYSSSWLNNTNESLTPIVSACSSPMTSKSSVPVRLQARRRTKRNLPLPLRKRSCHTPKERFAAFVAILLMYLDGGGSAKRNYKLSVQAKALVAECCRRNRMGDQHFTPLQASLSERLYFLVGQSHWDRARAYLYIYLARHHGFQPGRDGEEEDAQLLRHSKEVAADSEVHP